MSNFTHLFYDEASELLADLEIQLLELEKHPQDMECIGRIFRALHTIKGSGAMFGFDDVSAFTHNLENVFDLVRSEKLSVTPDLIDLSLKSCDFISRLLKATGNDEQGLTSEGVQLSLLIQKFLPGSNMVEKNSTDIKQVQSGNATSQLYYIHFAPFPDLFKMGINPLLLFDELQSMADLHIKCTLDEIPVINEIDPESCYLKWAMLAVSDKDELSIRDVFMFVEDISELSIHSLGPVQQKMDLDALLNQISISRAYEREELEKMLTVDQDSPKPGKTENSNGKAVSASVKAPEGQGGPTIRVASERLDSLVDLVGEFVTTQARFSQLAKSINESETVLLAEQMERLTNELRDTVMSLRMQPIGTMFGKFRRLVRDLSSELGKSVSLVTEGEKTELDKSVIEKLNDPIMHIIRNSIDHGIETEQDRKKSKKTGGGTITLAAFHSGANVVIKIIDDGKGLDKEAILKKAIEKSLISENHELSETEIYNLVLQPGFSTAKGVTKLSGRGVGMDVVKKTIDGLGGNVEIKSTPGVGTEITLVLPLTLAIIEGLLVTIQNEYFIFPLSVVEECVEMDKKEADAVKGRHLVNVRDQLVPYLKLREYFDITEEAPESQQIVIACINSQKFGFVVDRVIGSYQTVIKSLGQLYKNIEGISGATILGDGSVALILDLIKLEQAATLISIERFKHQ